MMDKSTHRVEVVQLGPIRKHENADTLGIVDVWGYTCIVRLADFREGDLAAYIPPDSIVPDVPAFAFLNGHRRIRVSRLRGILSQGLLIAAPPGATVGDDVATLLGITHYEPPIPLEGGELTTPPPGEARLCYDVDTLLRYAHVFERGESVWVTEKIHGQSARFCWVDGTLHVGSRTGWLKDHEKSPYYRALRATPAIARVCKAHPEWTLYGEVYGTQGGMRYGKANGATGFLAFDILERNRWLDAREAAQTFTTYGVPSVPLLCSTIFDLGEMKKLAEGPSLVPGADHVREGCVVKPLRERTHPEVGRVNLKIVGNGYLSRKE